LDYSIRFGGRPQDVTITTSGSASAQGLIGFVSDLVASPEFRPGMAVLVDHSDLDATTLSAGDVRRFADVVVRLDDRIGAAKVAILVPNALVFGFARMYELAAESAQVRSRVFYSREDALAWLREQLAGRALPEPA
jgi:hypothetical protein